MLQCQLLEHLDGGRSHASLAGLLLGRECQFVEQNRGQLLRRVDVELFAGLLEDRRLQLSQLRFHLPGAFSQPIDVDRDACLFYVGQDRDQRMFELAIQRGQAMGLQLLLEWRGRLEREIGPFAGVAQYLVGRNPVEVWCLGAFPADVLRGAGSISRVLERDGLEGGGRAGGVQQVAGQHRVQLQSSQADPVRCEPEHDLLEIVADDGGRLVLEERSETREHGGVVEMFG